MTKAGHPNEDADPGLAIGDEAAPGVALTSIPASTLQTCAQVRRQNLKISLFMNFTKSLEVVLTLKHSKLDDTYLRAFEVSFPVADVKVPLFAVAITNDGQRCEHQDLE